MTDNMEDAETRRERTRKMALAAGVSFSENPNKKREKDKKGLFGDFNFMDIFKKGGMKKVIASLGGTLFSEIR